MTRGTHSGNVKGNARRRLLKRETHGMAILLSERSLGIRPLSVAGDATLMPIVNHALLERVRAGDTVYLTSTHALERLAAFLGITAPAATQPEQRRRYDLIRAIQREEKRLSTCRRSERWCLPSSHGSKEEETT